MRSKKTIGIMSVVTILLLGFAVSFLVYSNKDNLYNSLPNTQPLSTGNRYFENFYDKPITDENIALDAIEANKNKLGYNNENISFKFIIENGYLGSSYRFKTLYKQIPIEPSTVIVTTHSDNKPKVLISGSIELSKLEKLDTTPKITQDEALRIARGTLGDYFSEQNIFGEKINPQLIIYETNNEYVLTYYINTGFYCCIINAENGDVIESKSTGRYNKAEYEGQNGDIQTISYNDYNDIENAVWDNTKNIFVINNRSDNQIESYTKDLVTVENLDSNKSAVDGFANTYRAVEYFQKNFGKKFDITYVRVNVNSRKDNAEGQYDIIDNKEIAFLTFYVMSNKNTPQYSAYLDAVAHEYAHIVTDSIAFGLNGYSKDSMYFENNALMEAYSDIFGELIEKDYTGKTDWYKNVFVSLIKHENSKGKKDYVYKYSKLYKGTEDYGGAHWNSTIISHAAYLMSKNNNNKKYDAEFLLDYNQLSKLWYGSLDYLDETSDFSDCRYAIEKSARDLIEKGILIECNLEIIEQAFNEVEVSSNPIRYGMKVGTETTEYKQTLVIPIEDETQSSEIVEITEVTTETTTTTTVTTPTYEGNIIDSGNCGADGDNVKWELYENGTLRIYGTGDMENFSSWTIWRNSGVQSKIKNVIIENGVTSIGEYAFYSENLESIKIPESITSIGDYAFYNCNNVVSVTIPDTITRIGQFAFNGTAWLENRKAENPVVVENGFLLCYGEHIKGDVIIPLGVKCIADGVFAHSGITSCTIPNGVIYIGDNAFNCCKNLNNVVLPDGLISIGREAFSGCRELTSIEIPESVMNFGTRCFDGYFVGETTPWFEKKREENPLVIVNNIIIDGRTCKGDVVIPNTVIKIADGAFENCSLNSINIPDSVESIGNGAFSKCENLASVTIPESVKDIGKAFCNCSSLSEITFLNPKCEIPISCFTIYNKIEEENYNINWYYDGVIKGFENSTAQKYAEHFEYKFNALEN